MIWKPVHIEARVVDATEFRVRRNGDVEHVATELAVLSPVEVESKVKRIDVAIAVVPAAPAEIVVTEKLLEADADCSTDG